MREREGLISYLNAEVFQRQAPEGAREGTQPFVTLSRQAGVGASAAASAILRALEREAGDPVLRGWRVFDRKLCEIVAADPKLTVRLDSLVNEEFRGAFEDYARQFVADASSQAKILRRMFQTIHAAASAGRAVIVGRGGACLTRDLPLGVHVRLVASRESRLRVVMRRTGAVRREAEKTLAAQDLSRARLVKTYFGRDIDDPLLYDAVFNADAMPLDAIAAVVVAMVKEKLRAVPAEELAGPGAAA